MVIDSIFISVIILLIVGLFVWLLALAKNTREAREHTQQIYQQQELVRTDPEAHRLSQAVNLLRPTARLGTDYTINCDRPGDAPCIYSWDTAGKQPEKSEIIDALTRVTAIDSKGYAAMRRSEYPSIEDQLDAAFKARRGNDSEQRELDQRIEEIKNKYPRSEADL